MKDEESQLDNIPKDYGTTVVPATGSADAGGRIEVAAAAAALRDSLALLPRKTAGGIFCAQTAKRGPS